MESLRVTGAAIPFGRPNVDTDLIIPSRYMKTVTREGVGEGCFAPLRGDPANLFDDSRYRRAPILVAGVNFGCGSSREHAVWALQQIGIRAIIAPSFGEIFESNALKNGLIAVRLSEEAVDSLLQLGPDDCLTIDVAEELVITPGGDRLRFSLDPFRKHCLINGLDDIEVTLAMEPEIQAYERRVHEERPWIFLPRPPEEPET